MQEYQLSVRGIAGLPDNITLGLHRVGKETAAVKKDKPKLGRRVSTPSQSQSHSISVTDVNIGYTGIDMKRELQISFGKLEAAESSMQVGMDCICIVSPSQELQEQVQEISENCHQIIQTRMEEIIRKLLISIYS